LSVLQQQIEKNKKLETMLAEKCSQTEDQDNKDVLPTISVHKETQTVDNNTITGDLDTSFSLMKEAHNEAVEK